MIPSIEVKFTLSGDTNISVNFLQPPNAPDPIEDTVAGITTDWFKPEYRNALLAIVVTELGIVMEVREEQL